MATVANEASLIAWNLDKRHLLELDDAGFPVPATTWVARDER